MVALILFDTSQEVILRREMKVCTLSLFSTDSKE
jgi:hypothetical protein